MARPDILRLASIWWSWRTYTGFGQSAPATWGGCSCLWAAGELSHAGDIARSWTAVARHSQRVRCDSKYRVCCSHNVAKCGSPTTLPGSCRCAGFCCCPSRCLTLSACCTLDCWRCIWQRCFSTTYRGVIFKSCSWSCSCSSSCQCDILHISWRRLGAADGRCSSCKILACQEACSLASVCLDVKGRSTCCAVGWWSCVCQSFWNF